MAGGPGGSGEGVSSNSALWTIVMSAFAGVYFFFFAASPSLIRVSPAFGGILFGYDTGTIGGIIAMDDWLTTFGAFDSSLGYYLPTKDKSLVVCLLLIFLSAPAKFSFDRSQFSLLVLSSALSLLTPSVIVLAANTVSSSVASSSSSVLAFNSTPAGSFSSSVVLSRVSVSA